MRYPLQIVLFALCIGVATAVVAGAQSNKPDTRVEQTKGNVRVVLLQVTNLTVVTDQEVKGAEKRPIPGLSVVYLVEALGSEPTKIWLTQGADVFSGTTNLSHHIPDNVIAGGHSSLNEFRNYHWDGLKQPHVADPVRAKVHKNWLRGVSVAGGKVDIHIVTGFNEQKESFDFRGITVD